MKEHKGKYKTRQNKKQPRNKEYIGFFSEVPFRSRELCFPCKICLVMNQLELVYLTHTRESIKIIEIKN